MFKMKPKIFGEMATVNLYIQTSEIQKNKLLNSTRVDNVVYELKFVKEKIKMK